MRHRDATARHGRGGVVVYFSMTRWCLMLNLSLSLCMDPELLVFVERGQKQPQRSVGYLQPKTFRRGSRVRRGNVQPLMWLLGRPAPATLQALHDDSL